METRLVAILLTDLSGYTAFSARAARLDLTAAVRQQQKLIPPLLKAYRGRLVKWIGDAALAVFGSATDAVLCGRRIQETFVESAHRGLGVFTPQIKVVVHVGDVMVDRDGDIYGDAVNFTARMEKAASADEVYFSEAVRRALPGAEVPCEPAGEFEFKGIPGKARVYRTCFGQTPVLRERVALVQTNFVGIQSLADAHGWDVVHPAVDAVTGAITEATRAHGGTSWGAIQVGSLLSFDAVVPALRAVNAWTTASAKLARDSRLPVVPKVRTGIHWGTLHVMKYTIMGRDIEVVRTFAALGFGDDVLLTEEAKQLAVSEGLPAGRLRPFGHTELRDCGNRARWIAKFGEMPLSRVALADLANWRPDESDGRRSRAGAGLRGSKAPGSEAKGRRLGAVHQPPRRGRSPRR